MNAFLEHMIVHWIQVYVQTLKVHMVANVCLVMMAMEELVLISTSVHCRQHMIVTPTQCVKARVKNYIYHFRLTHDLYNMIHII